MIVIIGILIAALLPRLQGAQAMARDTARQTALTTIGTAIAAYQLQTGTYPLKSGNSFTQYTGMTGTNAISEALKSQGIVTDVPQDKNADNVVFGLGLAGQSTTGDFAYALMKKNDIDNNGFILMAKTEMPGSSNRVVQSGATNLDKGFIPTNSEDMKNITLCSSVKLMNGAEATNFKAPTKTDSNCVATSQSELRYIYMY